MSPRLRVGGRSDVGLHRHNNQDSMYAGPHLVAVADGVGGAAGGEVASFLTITALMSLDTESVANPQAALREAAEQADASIRDTVARNPELAGMSTTLTAILATDDELTLAHIGDSRAYRLRNGELTQLTSDHTLVQSLIDEGQITEEEALTHPRRSWILRALDGRGQPDLDLIPLDIEPGDRYLVCSDGLSSYVSEADIAAGLSGDDPQVAAERLTDLALKAGGPDNISCVVADPMDAGAVHQPPILGGAVAGPPPPAITSAGPAAAPAADIEDVVVKPRSIGKRLAVVAAVVVILVAAGVAGVAVYIHRQWYIAPDGGVVAVYQGVQGNAAGIHLSHLQVRTDLPVSALPQDDRDRVTNGIQASGGHSGANDVVTNLRHEACAPFTPTPRPNPKIERPPLPVWCASTS